jgi:hypothetical protein
MARSVDLWSGCDGLGLNLANFMASFTCSALLS